MYIFLVMISSSSDNLLIYIFLLTFKQLTTKEKLRDITLKCFLSMMGHRAMKVAIITEKFTQRNTVNS